MVSQVLLLNENLGNLFIKEDKENKEDKNILFIFYYFLKELLIHKA
jgi:hypothetical protein